MYFGNDRMPLIRDAVLRRRGTVGPDGAHSRPGHWFSHGDG